VKKIRAISLFSGAGGMDLGFRRAGVDVVWANDFNASACETYKANFGSEIHCGSLMDFDYNTLPDCDLVFGGPPCQGFSVAGKMDPDDPRSKLVFEFQKVVGAKRPRFFVMENVAALGRLAKFAAIRKRLLECYSRMGYAVRFEILDSQHYKTPQRRERLIMIGTLCGADAIRFPKKSRHVITAHEVLAGLDEPGTGNNKGVCDARITTAKCPVLRTSPYAGMLFNGMGRPIDLSRPCQTLPASMGGNKTPIIDTRLLRHPDSPDWLRRLQARAVKGEDISEVMVPPFMRRITVSEAAALQGFPNDFKFLGSRCDKYRQIGNSVPPPLAEAIAREVVKAMQKSDR
jgi:DNA (cytosine-5)-methyltransferase 1